MKRYLSQVIAVGMVCLCLTSPAFAQTSQETPESVAKAYVAAAQAGDWAKCASLMHSDELASMKRKLAVEINTDKSGEAAKYAAKVLGVKSSADFAQLSEATVFERTMSFLIASTPELKTWLATSTSTVLGVVTEGPDLAHVVYRTQGEMRGAEMSKIELVSLKKQGTSWRVQKFPTSN